MSRGHDPNGRTVKVKLKDGSAGSFFCTYTRAEHDKLFPSADANYAKLDKKGRTLARAYGYEPARERHLMMHGPVSPELCPFMREEVETDG